MSLAHPAQPKNRSIHRTLKNRLSRRNAAQRKMMFEPLEGRALMATFTWDGGGGANTNWSNGLNWVGDVAPVAGDDIIFTGAASTTNINDLAPGALIDSIAFSAGAGNFTINGNPLVLLGGVDVDSTVGSQTLNTPLIFNAASTVNVAGGSLTLGSTIAGTGSLTKTGAGELSISGAVLLPNLNVSGGTLSYGTPATIVKLANGPIGNPVPTTQVGLTNIARATAGATPFASSSLVAGTHSIAGLNDGVYGNSNSWIGVGANALAGVDLPGATIYTVSGLSFGRDNDGVLPDFIDRTTGTYTVYRTLVADPNHTTSITGDANTGWVSVGDINVVGEPIRKSFALAPFNTTGVMLRVSNDGICIDELEVYGDVAGAAPVTNLNVTATSTVNLGAGISPSSFNISGAGTVATLNGAPAAGSGAYAIGPAVPGSSVPAGTPVPDNLALASNGSTAFANSVFAPPNPAHTIPHLNDGLYGNSNSWIGVGANSLAGIDLPGATAFNISSVSFGRDNVNTDDPLYVDRSDATYTFYHTLVANPNSSLAITGNPATGWASMGSVVVSGSPLKKTYPVSQGGQPVPMTGFMISPTAAGVAIDEIEINGVAAPAAPINLPNMAVTASSSSTLNLGLPASPATFGALSIAGGGALTLSGASTITFASLAGTGAGGGSVGGTPNIQLPGAGTINVAGGMTLAVNSIISGANNMTKTGTGTLALNALNTYSGNNFINEGLVIAGASNIVTAALGAFNASPTKVVIASGATLDINGRAAAGLDFIYGITIAGSGTSGQGALINNGAHGSIGNQQNINITLSNNATIGGTGDIYMIAGGYNPNTLTLNGFTLTKTGSNTFFPVSTTVTAGTINIVNGTVSQVSPQGSAPNYSAVNFTLANTAGAQLNLGGRDMTIASLAGGGTTGGNVNLGANRLTINQTGNTAFAGQITGTGGLTKSGAGTLALNNATSNYSGGTIISQGTVTIGAPAGAGTGLVTLNDANTGSSNTAFLATFANAGTRITNAITVANAGSGTSSIGTTSFNPGAVPTLWNGLITLNKATTFTAGNTDRTTYESLITGPAGTITVTGGARTTWDNTNTFTGNVQITGANTILQLNTSTNVIPDASNVDVGAGAFLYSNNASETIAGLSGTGTVQKHPSVATPFTLTVGFNNASSTFGGTITNGNGVVSLTKTGGGVQYMDGASSYTGLTTVNDGYLVARNNLALGSAVGGTVVNNPGTLQLESTVSIPIISIINEPLTISGFGVGGTRGALANWTGNNTFSGPITIASNSSIFVNSGNLTLSGVISGAAGLTKTGAGTLTLAGVNTYTGATNVDAGSLKLQPPAPLPTDLPGNFNGYGANLNGFQDFFTTATRTTGWTVSGPGGDVYSQSGNGLLHVVTAAGDPNHLLYEPAGLPTSATWDVLARVRLNTAMTGAVQNLQRGGIGAGVAQGGGGFNQLFQPATSVLMLNDQIAWGPTVATTYNVGDWYWMRLTTNAANQQTAKFWPADGATPEPASATSWNQPSRIGFAGITASSNSGPVDMDMDYILIQSSSLPSIAGVGVTAGSSILPTTTAVTVASGAIFDLNGSNATIGSLAGAGTVTTTVAGAAALTTGGNNSSTTFSGVINNGAGTVSLGKTGTGTMILSGGNTYTGATTVTGGTLSINQVGPGSNNANVGPGANTQLTTSALNVSSGATAILNTNSNFSSSNTSTTLAGAGTIRLASGTWWLGNGGGVGGGTNLAMSPGGLLDIQAGKLTNDYANANWSANQGSLNVAAGAQFDLRNNNARADALTGGGAIFDAGFTNSLTIGVSSGSGIFTGTLGVGGTTMSLTKTGTGSQTLGGTASNTYTGTTIVDNGILVLAKTGGAVAISGPVQMGNGNANQAQLNTEAANQFGPGVVMSLGAGTNPHARFSLQGFNQTLAGINSPTSFLVIQNERLQSPPGSPGGTSQPATLTLNGTGTYSFAGFLRDEDDGGHNFKLSLVKTGTGTQTLAGTNINYEGGTTITTGTLRFDFVGVPQLPGRNLGAISVGAAGTLEFFNTNTDVDNLLINGTTNITGTGKVLKTGPGYVGLWTDSDSIRDFAGLVDIQQGTIGSNDNGWQNSAGLMDLNIAANASFDMRVQNVRINRLTGSGRIGSSHNVNVTLFVGSNNGSSQYDGIIRNGQDGTMWTGAQANAGIIGVTKVGTGSIILNGALDYTGATTVTGGTLEIRQVGSGSNNANIGTGANTQLATSSLNVSSGATAILNTNSNFSSANTGTTLTGAGTIRLASGVWWMGNAGSGTNVAMSPGGLIDVQGGTVTNDYASANWATNQGSLNMAAGTFLNLRNNNVRVDSLTGAGTILSDCCGGNTLTVGVANGSGVFSGPIQLGTSVVALSKVGNGMLTLTGNNTYSGGTVVTGGILRVNSAVGSATGSGQVTVQANATLEGEGSIGGNLTVQSSGLLSPGLGGDDTGTLSVGGSVDLQAGSLLKADIDGAANDQVRSTGNFTANATLSSLSQVTNPTQLTRYVIGNNLSANAVIGNFAGLPQGTQFVFDGRNAVIVYNHVATPSAANDIAIVFSETPSLPAPGNAPPVVEGSAAAHSGAYSDEAGDNVTITASVGSVTKTGTNAGTWTWTGPITLDGPAGPFDVTITATDSVGIATQTTFQYSVINGAPTAVLNQTLVNGDPVTGSTINVVPGLEFTFVVSANDPSSPNTADAPFTFAINWGDSTPATVPLPTTSAEGATLSLSHTYSSFGTFHPTLVVTDADGTPSATFNLPTVISSQQILVDGVLYVSGTDSADRIIVQRGTGGILVKMNGVALPALGVDTKVVVFGREGGDNITVSSVNIPVEFYGGPGNDYLAGGNARDILDGGPDADRLLGGGGDDVLLGGGGSDTLGGGNGVDYLSGDDQVDPNGDPLDIAQLVDPILVSAAADGGRDTLNGDAGNDTVRGGAQVDRVNGGTGNDILRGGDDGDILDGGANDDVLYGEAGGDTLYGRAGRDILIGGLGGDYILGYTGQDLLFGGDTPDIDDDALLAILTLWTTGQQQSAADDLEAAAEDDNGALDVLHGEADSDWYLMYLTNGDSFKMATENKLPNKLIDLSV